MQRRNTAFAVQQLMVKNGYAEEVNVWLPAEVTGNKEAVWTEAVVLAQSGPHVTLRTQNSRSLLQLDLRKVPIARANPDLESAPDNLTSMHFVNEPSILHALDRRAANDQPYTFLGSVLVYVNPLKWLEDPPGLLGSSHNLDIPHPYSIAETAFQQMSFAADKRRKRAPKPHSSKHVRGESHDQDLTNQSIITSGESGAGKTECTKMILRQLMARAKSANGGTTGDAVKPRKVSKVKGRGKKKNSSAMVESPRSNNSLQDRILQTSPVVESFGNAMTLRNANSSRFGKLIKLFFKQINTTSKSGQAEWSITCASVESYLLEKSRVTNQASGERNFRVFYEMLEGCHGNQRHELGLDAPSVRDGATKGSCKGAMRFSYLSNPGAEDHKADTARGKLDNEKFQELQVALGAIGLDEQTSAKVFQLVAAILHLGNVEFVDKELDHGNVAALKNPKREPGFDGSYSPFAWAATLLKVTPEKLEQVILEHELIVGKERTVIQRNASAAKFALDAIAKGLYSLLFDWLIAKINVALGFLDSSNQTDAERESQPTIGILDIFGFESFAVNGFPQLLINLASEALNATFAKSILVHEHELFQKEGLVLDGADKESSAAATLVETGALDLLLGSSVQSLSNNQLANLGLLVTIDSECQSPEPSDAKLNSTLHRLFDANPFFIRPHPKDIAYTFIVQHYAGAVTYNVGNFVKMNNDRLPAGVEGVFASSKDDLVVELFDYFGSLVGPPGGGIASGGPSSRTLRKSLGRRPVPSTNQVRRRNRNTSIVAKFRQQVQNLLNQLSLTRSSFVRCIKPNPDMARRAGWWSRAGVGWFNRQYVSEQLRVLSIPQTAQVLRDGLPTRMPYAQFIQAYKKILPEKALNMWKQRGHANKQAFVSALFFAFKIDPSAYRLGHTLVFFENGKLAELEKILLSAGHEDQDSEELGRRFMLYYVRILWRRAVIKIKAWNRFTHIWHHVKKEQAAAIAIQKFLRRQAAVRTLEKLKAEERKRVKRLKRAAEKKKKAKARREKEKADKEKAKLAEKEELDRIAKEKEEAERVAKEEEAEKARVRAQVAEEARLKRIKDAETQKKMAKKLPERVERVSELSRKILDRKQSSHIGGRVRRETKLVRAASGKRSIVVDEVLSQSEAHRPLISAEEHLSKLEGMVANGEMTEEEFMLATPKVVENVDSERKAASSPNRPTMHKKSVHQRGRSSVGTQTSKLSYGALAGAAADEIVSRLSFEHGSRRRLTDGLHSQQYRCEKCGKVCNTMYGKTCLDCGEEAKDLPTALRSGLNRMATEFDVGFDADIDAVPDDEVEIEHTMSQHEDWVGELPFRDGQVMFRVAGSEVEMDHTSFTQIRLFVIQLRWLTGNRPLNWKVRHSYQSHQLFHEELSHGKLSQLVPLKIRRTLPRFEADYTFSRVEQNIHEREAALREWLSGVLSTLSNCPTSGKHSIEAVLGHPSFDSFFELPFYSSVGRIRRPVSRVGSHHQAPEPIDSLKKRTKHRNGVFSFKSKWSTRYMRLDDEVGVLYYSKSRASLDDVNKRKAIPYSSIVRVVIGMEDPTNSDAGFVEHSFGNDEGVHSFLSSRRMMNDGTNSKAHPDRVHSDAALDFEIELVGGKKLVFRTPNHIQADIWVNFLNDRIYLKARVYTVDELNRFPEAFIRQGRAVPDTAICFSGGGSRSLAAAMGQLRALTELDLVRDDRVGYISGVSGGAWASGIFTFYQDCEMAQSDTDLLGTGYESVSDLKHLSLMMLQHEPPALGRTAQAKLVSIAKSKVMSNKSYITSKSHELWGDVIAEAYLHPFNIGGDVPFSMTSLVDEARKRNPLLNNFEFVTARKNRPFWICNGAILGPEVSRLEPRDLVPLHMTAMYVGSPMLHQITYDRKSRWSSKGATIRYKKVWVGGGLLESYAFGSPAPIGHQQIPFPFELPPVPEFSKHRSRQRMSRRPNALSVGSGGSYSDIKSVSSRTESEDGTGARPRTLEDVMDTTSLHRYWTEDVPPPDLHQVTVQPPSRPFSLKHALAISSHMVGMEYTKSNVTIRFNQHDLYWSPNPELFDEVQDTMFDIADGYLIDNTGLLSVLQRNVRRAVVFVNGQGALTRKYDESKPETWVGDEIPALFGYTRATEVGRFKRNGQVFASEDLLRLHDGIADRLVNDEPVIVTQKYPVLENNWLGIVGGYEVEVMWFFINECKSFNKLLSKEVQQEIAKGSKGELANFPGYSTFGQVQSGDVALSSVQINLLAKYTEWMVRQKSSKLKKWFPEVDPVNDLTL